MCDNKYIKDCVHGLIKIPKALIPFVDNPYFQRLRRVKQLANSSLTYPSATHTRLQHSIGVMHIARTMIKNIGIKIPTNLKKLVLIAALYHDIGHVAYSHLFDRYLELTSVESTFFQLKDHEERAHYIIKLINDEYKLLTNQEVNIVIDIISGKDNDEYPFVYQIVNNRKTGVDADRIDYIMRDSYYLGLTIHDPSYMLAHITVDSNENISFYSKAKGEVVRFLEGRDTLFEVAYLHRTSVKYDKLIFCMLYRLGPEALKYNEWTDDYNIETLIRSNDNCKDLVKQLDCRDLSHDCDICHGFSTKKKPQYADSEIMWV